MNTTQLPLTPLSACSLKELQHFNQSVYEIVNRRNFELSDMVCRLSRYNARVSLRIRKEDTERTPYHLCMMLSWLLAIANRLFLGIQQEVAAVCMTVTQLPPDASLTTLQTFFASRHSDTTLEKAALCLSEKVHGIASALEYYRETHDEGHFRDTAKKMAQCIEALCVVASKLKVNLSTEFELHFSRGCSTCHHIPCHCGFRADKVI